MPAGAISFLAVILIPTIIAASFALCLGPHVHGVTRKFFIVLLYLIPWNWGSSFGWNRKPSRRETFFIVWFIAFIITLLVLQ